MQPHLMSSMIYLSDDSSRLKWQTDHHDFHPNHFRKKIRASASYTNVVHELLDLVCESLIVALNGNYQIVFELVRPALARLFLKTCVVRAIYLLCYNKLSVPYNIMEGYHILENNSTSNHTIIPTVHFTQTDLLVISIVAIAVGIALAFLGRKLFKPTLFIVCYYEL